MEIYMLNNDGGIKFTPNYNTEQRVRDACIHDGSSRWKTQVLTVLCSLLAIVFLFLIENNAWAQCVVGPIDQVVEDLTGGH